MCFFVYVYYVVCGNAHTLMGSIKIIIMYYVVYDMLFPSDL